jgi:DNA-directed RNA polymerase specialized sigma subunit
MSRKQKTLSILVSPATAAMYDLLSDGKSHAVEEVLTAGKAGALRADYLKCVEEGKRARHGRDATLAEYAHSGARAMARNNLMIAKRNGKIVVSERKNSEPVVKMPAEYAKAWVLKRRASRNVQGVVVEQDHGNVTYYAGMPEWDGWAYAPLVSKDVVHVRPSLPIPIEKLKNAFPGWDVSESPEGLITISAISGAPVKEVVSEWFREHDIPNEGVRDAKAVKRRELSDLPKKFLNDLVRHNVPFARGIIAAKSGTAMQKIVGDRDDIDGYVAQWVLELITSFDPSKKAPFGTWVANQMKRKVHDLNRSAYGRTATDIEIKFSRAIQKLEEELGRTPNNEEIQKHLNLSSKEMREKLSLLSNLSNLRSMGTIETGPDQAEIAIEDPHPQPEDIALSREQSQHVTLALLAASGQIRNGDSLPTITMPLGFLVWYLMHWDDWVKGDLIYLAGCADRKVTDELEKVRQELMKLLSEYRS